ncbi:DUF3037 domain-containing protein [Telmatobacter sp. DSM 110680]|uniref:DUF3037 domain-containing protein n=1 Tax=Telmatobacter sp. DSM 110680 TaxID=3036704 RepID=A0AAU7DN75_9BACT
MTTDQERLRCEFQLLRYVPDPVRNEFVHVGVLLREQAAPQGGGAEMELRFTRDWRRVRCLHPDADTSLLEGMETELRHRLGHDPDGKMMRILNEALSLNVQMTAPKAYLAESLPAGIEELMRMYVDPPKRERVPRLSGRAAIQSLMRAEFEHAGVWDLLRKRIPASDYTRPGDPLRLDVGYRPNGVIRMFHAVSLEPGLDLAKVLAFSAEGLRAGVERVEKASLELTAIVEPAAKLGASDEDLDRLTMYRFGVETMEENQIRVLTTADMSRVAETARRELSV